MGALCDGRVLSMPALNLWSQVEACLFQFLEVGGTVMISVTFCARPGRQKQHQPVAKALRRGTG